MVLEAARAELAQRGLRAPRASGDLEQDLAAALELIPPAPGEEPEGYGEGNRRGVKDLALDVLELYPSFTLERWTRAARSAPRPGAAQASVRRAVSRWRALLRVYAGAEAVGPTRIDWDFEAHVTELGCGALAWAEREVARA